MKKISFHPSQLQVVYFVIYVALFGLIIYIPQLIDSPLHITKRLILEEEIGEGILLLILFLLNILILNLYKKETARQKAVIEKINKDERSLIQAITNEITMIFIILNSVYYKEPGMLVPDRK